VSRFLITCWPYTGHVLPQMSIALALRERGHQVAFYTGLEARAKVEAEGFELFGFDRVQEQQVSRLVHAVDTGDRRSRPGGGRVVRIFRNWLVETIPDQVADLRSVLAHWTPNVIATDLSMWGPILVLWETEQIPVALSSTFMGPLIPGPDAPAFGFGLGAPRTPRARARSRAITALTDRFAMPMRRRVDEIRAGYGLPSLDESVNRFTGRLPLYLVGSVPELDYNRRDLPPSVHYVGNYIWYPPAAPGETEWLDAIPTQRPWVHVTESSLATGDPFLARTTIEALASEPVEVIVTTGGQRDPEQIGLCSPAPNVHVRRWLSHGELLPRCGAVVTVGGPATILASLSAGAPLVVVPTTWDKPDNARRVTETGAGVSIRARQCTPESLRAAVRQVLGDRRYRAAALRLAARFAAAPGAAGAAELLERLAPEDRSRPVPTVTTVQGGAG
jgi:MGT family glycosyltransferase